MGSIADKLTYTLSSVEKIKAMLSEKGIDTNVALDRLLGEQVVQNIAKGNALESDVLTGKSFTNEDGMLRMGTIPTVAPTTMMPKNVNIIIPKGYHDGSGEIKGDANLTAANIKSGVSIFNTVGTLKMAQGNAVESDVLLGKTFTKADGVLRTGAYKERIFWVNSIPWSYVLGSGASVKYQIELPSPNGKKIEAARVRFCYTPNIDTQWGNYIFYIAHDFYHDTSVSASYWQTGVLRKELISDSTGNYVSGYPAMSSTTSNPATWPNAYIHNSKTLRIQMLANDSKGYLDKAEAYIITE